MPPERGAVSRDGRETVLADNQLISPPVARRRDVSERGWHATAPAMVVLALALGGSARAETDAGAVSAASDASAASADGAAAPDTAAPNTAAPDTGAPATAAPDTGAPATAAPDTGAPATAAPTAIVAPAPAVASRTQAGRPFETVVKAPPRVVREPREDQAAAGSVVIPDDSPRTFDDLGTLLAEVPGVNVTRTGSLGSFATLSLRGSNPDEVRIYVDGVPLNIAEGGAVDISTLPLGDVERVEVYRGSTPLAFGESALGGVIAITTRTPGEKRATLRAGVGSFGTEFADASAGRRVGPVRLYVGAHGLMSVGDYPYHNDNGTTVNPSDDTNPLRTNNDVEQADGVVRAALDLRGRRTLSLGVVGFGRDQGLPGIQKGQPTMFSRFRTARALMYVRYDSRDDLGPGARVSAQVFASAQRDGFHDPFGEIVTGSWLTHDTTLSTGATAYASRPFAPWVRLSAIGEARVERFTPVNDGDPTNPIGAPAQRVVGAGGLESDLFWRWANLNVIPSVRVEAVRDVVTGRDVVFQTPRPADPPITRALPIVRVGLVRPLAPGVVLKANAGRYARIPSFLELYAGTGYLLGNPTLRPEWGRNGDVALWIDRGTRVHVSSRTTVYGALVDDLIEWEFDAYGRARADNLSSARIWGVEQDVRLGFGDHVQMVAQGTFNDAEDEGPGTAHHGKQLPRRPRWRGYLRPEVVRLLERRGWSLGAFVDGELTAGNYEDAADVVELPTRFLLGAGISAELPRWGLRATASAQNLTGYMGNDLPNLPLPGRTVFVALGWSATGDRNRYQRSD